MNDLETEKIINNIEIYIADRNKFQLSNISVLYILLIFIVLCCLKKYRQAYYRYFVRKEHNIY